MQRKMLFPPYLNKGSHGAAVDALHLILFSLGFGQRLARDGEYGETTADAVRRLQNSLGCAIDGNFGPETREALYKRHGIRVELIAGNTRQDCTTFFYGPDTPPGIPERWEPDLGSGEVLQEATWTGDEGP